MGLPHYWSGPVDAYLGSREDEVEDTIYGHHGDESESDYDGFDDVL